MGGEGSGSTLTPKRLGAVAGFCALISVLPFLFTPLPMMPDLFNHMARYAALYADGATASRLAGYYEVHWTLVANLGMDLLVYPFIRVFGTWHGPIIATALLPPLMIGALAALSRAAWGRIVPTFFLALPFVYTYSFLFGFTNYHLAVALACIVTAGWIALPDLSAARRWVVFAPSACVVWLAHLAGWGVLVVLVGAAEVVTGWRRSHAPFPTLWRSGLACLPLAVPVIPIVLHTGPAGIASGMGRFFDWPFKERWLAFVLASEWQPFDLASLALLVGLATFLVMTERDGIEPRLLAGASALGALFLILPRNMAGSSYADERLLPVAFMVFFLSFAPRRSQVQAICFACGLALFLSRLVLCAVGWHERGREALADLAVLRTVPEGSRIAVFGTGSLCDPWPLGGYDELPSLAIMDRHVFVNTVWNQPGTTLMRPVYNKDFGFNEVNSSYERSESCPIGRTADAFLEALPRSRFDYVWTFSAASFADPGLAFVAAGPKAKLYRVLR